MLAFFSLIADLIAACTAAIGTLLKFKCNHRGTEAQS